MKKLLWLIVLVLCTVISTIPNLKGNEDILKTLPTEAQISVNVLLIAAALIVQFKDGFGDLFSGGKNKTLPKPKLTQSQNKDFIDLIDDLNNGLKKWNIEVSVNVMNVKRRWFCLGKPFKSNGVLLIPSLYVDFFDPIFGYPAGVYDDLGLTVSQGVCGEAFRLRATKESSVLCYALKSKKGVQDFRLSKRQMKMTNDLHFVASCPIVLRRVHNGDEVWLRCGVLNVESESKNASKLLSAQRNRFFKQAVARLAEKYGTFYP